MNIHLLKKLAATLIVGAITTLAGPASARSLPASAGTAGKGTQRANFTVGPAGVSGSGFWATALPIDIVGTTKFVTITGGLNPGHTLTCQVDSFNSNGVRLGSSVLVEFEPTGTFQARTVGLPGSFVPAGARVIVHCGMSSGGTLVGFNYNP